MVSLMLSLARATTARAGDQQMREREQTATAGDQARDARPLQCPLSRCQFRSTSEMACLEHLKKSHGNEFAEGEMLYRVPNMHRVLLYV